MKTETELHDHAFARKLLHGCWWTLFGVIMLTALIATAFGADAAPAAPATESPWVQPNVVSAAFALVTGLIGIWFGKRKGTQRASTTEKVLRSVILGVEAAGRLPPAALNERGIKDTIKRHAILGGVQAVLDPLVQQVTRPRDEAAAEPTELDTDGDTGADRP